VGVLVAVVDAGVERQAMHDGIERVDDRVNDDH
jgi:hypothetical protein